MVCQLYHVPIIRLNKLTNELFFPPFLKKLVETFKSIIVTPYFMGKHWELWNCEQRVMKEIRRESAESLESAESEDSGITSGFASALTQVASAREKVAEGHAEEHGAYKQGFEALERAIEHKRVKSVKKAARNQRN